MSIKEIDRLHIIEKVCKKGMKLNKAAKFLNISTRQVLSFETPLEVFSRLTTGCSCVAPRG